MTVRLIVDGQLVLMSEHECRNMISRAVQAGCVQMPKRQQTTAEAVRTYWTEYSREKQRERRAKKLHPVTAS